MTLKLHVGWRFMSALFAIIVLWLAATLLGNAYLHDSLPKSWIIGGLLLLLAVATGSNTQFVFGETLVRYHGGRGVARWIGPVVTLAWIAAVAAVDLFTHVTVGPEWTIGVTLLIVVMATALRFRAERLERGSDAWRASP